MEKRLRLLHPGTTIKSADAHPRGPSRTKDTGKKAKTCDIVWNQAWRKPLRDATDWLRDELIPLYETEMARYVADPWKARDDYISVILDRSAETHDRFFLEHASRTLSDDEKSTVLKLLEMQRHAMLMYTSCGWFFEDISGIESIQVMRYACRAMQLAREISGNDPEPVFISYLFDAKSNIPEQENGAFIYRNYVQRSMIDLKRIVFNYALSVLITDNHEPLVIRHYIKKHESYEKSESGDIRIVIGTLTVRSDITCEEKKLEYAVLHLENYEFMGGILEFTDEAAFIRMKDSLKTALMASDVPLLVRTMEQEFGTSLYSLWHLFKDAQRKTLFRLLESTLEDMETSYRQIYRQHITLIHAMKDVQIPVPKIFEDPVWYILNVDLNKALSGEVINRQKIRQMVNEMTLGQFSPDKSTLNFTTSKLITSLTKKLVTAPDDIPLMQEIVDIFAILAPLSLNYELWECQTDYFYTGKKQLAFMQHQAAKGDSHAVQWVALFRELGTWFGVKCI